MIVMGLAYLAYDHVPYRNFKKVLFGKWQFEDQ
jgi:hypothetical protein